MGTVISRQVMWMSWPDEWNLDEIRNRGWMLMKSLVLLVEKWMERCNRVLDGLTRLNDQRDSLGRSTGINKTNKNLDKSSTVGDCFDGWTRKWVTDEIYQRMTDWMNEWMAGGGAWEMVRSMHVRGWVGRKGRTEGKEKVKGRINERKIFQWCPNRHTLTVPHFWSVYLATLVYLWTLGTSIGKVDVESTPYMRNGVG